MANCSTESYSLTYRGQAQVRLLQILTGSDYVEATPVVLIGIVVLLEHNNMKAQLNNSGRNLIKLIMYYLFVYLIITSSSDRFQLILLLVLLLRIY